MFTRIDHVMICVPDLQRGIEQCTKLGFKLYPSGASIGFVRPRGNEAALA